MKNKFSTLFAFLLFYIALPCSISANPLDDGYEIKIKLTDFKKDTLLLGYHLGDQMFIKDTAVLDKQTGFFTFKGKDKLQAGIYLLASPPDMFIQIIVNENEQKFTLATSTKEPYKTVDLKNSEDNNLFFSYMRYISDKTKDAETVKSLLKQDSLKAFEQLKKLDNEVKSYQETFVKKNTGTVSATLIKTGLEVEVPPYNDIKDKEARDLARYYYYKDHYFDNFEMGNPAIFRSPALFQRIDNFIEKYTPQYPDSINQSLDKIFTLLKPNKEAFRYYFIHYFNKYAQTKYVGFDAIYVHLVKKYIETGETQEFITNQEKIIENANKIAPTLIGKKAPEITVFIQDSIFNEYSQKISLYDVKARYTVLFFYRPDCGHCQKQSPDLVAFAQKMKAKNIDVKIFTTCTNSGLEKERMAECLKYIQEKGFGDFINTMDPLHISHYGRLYNTYMTPQVFVLDKDKIIRSKSIEAKQLESVIDMLIQEENRPLKDGLKR